jgi:hypothetical protein
MVKANELRIGNWFYYNNALKRIVAITSGNTVKLNTLPKMIEDDILELIPIPLTPELLENCGFIRSGCLNDTVYWNEQARISYSFGNYAYPSEDLRSKPHVEIGRQQIYPKRLMYLHQLQNLYFSLTNQELTIHL